MLVVQLVERAQPDPSSAPTVRYRRTSSKPVNDRAGNQAPAQLFAKTKAHGRQPILPPTPLDADGDGTPNTADCAPQNAAIHPGAADLPDLAFVDSNCDAIDGTERDAIFVSPNGLDSNPGTKADPKRELQAAVDAAAAAKKRYVLVAFGTYKHVRLATGISIFGGYDPTSWARRDRFPDGLPLISGSPDGVLANGAKDVVLQHLEIRGSSSTGERSAYGIRALNSASRFNGSPSAPAARPPGCPARPERQVRAAMPGSQANRDPAAEATVSVAWAGRARPDGPAAPGVAAAPPAPPRSPRESGTARTDRNARRCGWRERQSGRAGPRGPDR